MSPNAAVKLAKQHRMRQPSMVAESKQFIHCYYDLKTTKGLSILSLRRDALLLTLSRNQYVELA